MKKEDEDVARASSFSASNSMNNQAL